VSRPERIELYKKIEEHRKRPLISYVTSKRAGVVASMATDALPCIIEQIDSLPQDSKNVDFLIVSYGGDPMVAWRILTLLRQRLGEDGNVAVLIPQSAYSAATLVAFGANNIVIHPNGHLGPVDMQISTTDETGVGRIFSTEDITAFLDFVRDTLRITDQEHVRMLFELTCKEVGSLGIGFTARSSKLAVDLGERLLGMHMKGEDARAKLRSIVESMSRKFHSHAYPVSRTEALELGLPVTERDTQLEDLIWKAWLDIAEELQENSPFEPVFELMKSAEAKKLLSPVPQFDLPVGIPGNLSYQTQLEDVVKHAKMKIEPVDFQYTNAIVESARLAHVQMTKGKILASRTQDMKIRYNAVATSRMWEKV